MSSVSVNLYTHLQKHLQYTGKTVKKVKMFISEQVQKSKRKLILQTSFFRSFYLNTYLNLSCNLSLHTFNLML